MPSEEYGDDEVEFDDKSSDEGSAGDDGAPSATTFPRRTLARAKDQAKKQTDGKQRSSSSSLPVASVPPSKASRAPNVGAASGSKNPKSALPKGPSQPAPVKKDNKK
jgi:hypothetical protein